MVDSTARAEVEKWRRWKRNHPDFPLCVHPSGRWCKKIKGRVYYFGPLPGWKEARDIYRHDREYLEVGEDPPKSGTGIKVGELLETYRKHVEGRRDAGELSVTYARDVVFAIDFAKKHMVCTRPVKALRPTHFSKLRQAVRNTPRKLQAQKSLIMAIRGIFRWGSEMELHEPVRFGPEFKPPSSDQIAQEREALGRTRFIDREVVLSLLKHAKPHMKCMILLGINCGFYASDSIHLTFNRLHVDHDIPHHDFSRVKNGRRRVAMLWPETVAALESYIQGHRGKNESNRVILNQYGRPYTADAVGRGIRAAFRNLADTAEVTLGPGVSIGSLRHTYGTVVDLAHDQQMIDLSMGHAATGMQKRIYSQLNLGELDRLAVVAEVVRQWLYHGKIAGVPHRDGAPDLRVVG